MPESIQFARQSQMRFLTELIEFLSIPSISTQPAHQQDTARAAQWLANSLQDAGLEHIQVVQTQGHPLVYGDWLHAGPEVPTVLIYGHYDVQPPEPLELWVSPPFSPDVREDHVYARGASDDKGQLYIHVKAAEAYLKTSGRLPVNLKFIIEGEEESGGGSLRDFIHDERELLAADSALISDTAMVGAGRPALVYGLRGNCHMLVDFFGPSLDLHSGSYGGGINNPLNVLGHVIASLKDLDGHILIPGFYDKVRPLSDEEKALLAQFPFDEEVWLHETGAPSAWGEPEYTLIERISARPTLDVTGMTGGYTAKGTKTVLPAHAHVKVSMRLVPDQDPAEIAAQFERHVRAMLPPSITARFHTAGASRATLLDRDSAAMRAASAAYEATFGVPPVLMREGGSIPVVNQFQEDLGLPTVLMGFGLPGDHIHSPNERLYLPNFYAGVETSIRYLGLLGQSR